MSFWPPWRLSSAGLERHGSVSFGEDVLQRRKGLYMSTGGFIYAIGASGTSLVKIGYAKNVERRLRTLQTGHPFVLQVLASIAVDADAQGIERQVHVFLAGERRRGEWFEVAMDEEKLGVLVVRAVAYLAEQGASKVPSTRQIMSERILLRRRQLDLSQQELAEQCGFPYQVISGLERGRQSIYAERLKLLAQALRVSTDYLLGLSDTIEERNEEMESEMEPAAVALVGA